MIGGPIAQQEPPLGERRYRTGRGGFDPEAAAQLAQAKYVFRQRVVLGLVLAALATAVLAWMVSGLLWWMHTALDVAIVSYLGYLRRQVRIEEDVRQRRAARFAGSRGRTSSVADRPHDAPLEANEQEEPSSEPPTRPAAESVVENSTAVAVDFDDEDPIFDELRPAFEPPYRRAAGE
jgi:hypothetical protein